MSVDIFVAEGTDARALDAVEASVSLTGDDLDAVLLSIQAFTGYPTASGGPALDEYGTNIFPPSELPALRAALALASAHFHAGPDHIRVFVGATLGEPPQEFYREVSRSRLLAVTAALENVTDAAIKAGASLFVSGD